MCGQNPCPGPAWLNVSFVSGCLGFPSERQYNDHLRPRDASRIINKNMGVHKQSGWFFLPSVCRIVSKLKSMTLACNTTGAAASSHL